jgi:hypothetical protein
MTLIFQSKEPSEVENFVTYVKCIFLSAPDVPEPVICPVYCCYPEETVSGFPPLGNSLFTQLTGRIPAWSIS